MIITPEIRQEWEAVGYRIREIRKSKDMTLEEMESKSKISTADICKFENGRSTTSINYTLFLRNEFGASFDWIYEGERFLKEHKPKNVRCKTLDPIAIGLRLKKIREKLGLNRVEFGKVTGVYIFDLEKGERIPRIETAKKIKQAIGKPLDWIYFGDEIVVPKSVAKAKKQEKKQLQHS
ncbi:MAG: transcriptional regulator [Candidatus Liberibacter europaeus]|uniref:Transcriptional regulator n=1 Tax=Candidatus Liberibacter europaeus TaxID=744859 RepID=A0A2T4VWT5_9HYPH|nr:MAG: transcriptional regulator [Candidatus Liberibacter europaeus]